MIRERQMSGGRWFGIAALVAWSVGAALSRRYGLWLGVGSVSLALGILALALDVEGVRRRCRPRLGPLVVGVVVGAAMALASWALFPVAVAIVPAIARASGRLYAGFSTIPPAAAMLLLPLIIAGEELVWRGVAQSALAPPGRDRLAVLVAAVAYAAAHAATGSPLLVAVAFACGLSWSALRLATGGLVAPFVAHLLWDVSLLFIHPLDGLQ